MKIEQNYNLSNLNTFGIPAKAKFFVEIKQESDIPILFQLPEFKNNKKMFLGGGSNILFTKDFDGIIILNKLKGIKIINEDEDTVTIRAMGGEPWNNLVDFAVDRGYWGIENLALIPGTVGAGPMQNIGAYGAELKDTLLNVETYEIKSGAKMIFDKEKCALGYRTSIFKTTEKGNFFIYAINIRLSKKEIKNTNYKILADFLEENKIKIRGPKDISDAVASIRRSKLPDPKIIGNAGSFFKNVFVEKQQLDKLQNKFSTIPYFNEEEKVKIPAGWLIEQCGWKGKRVGNVGVHERQALVIVNYGGATGAELITLASDIIKSVKQKFDLDLVPEVNIV